MIGSLRKNQVRILESVKTDGGALQAGAREPDEDPFAMGVDGLLTSELYGLVSVLPKEITDKIDDRNLLFAKHARSPKEEERLSSLSAELAELGVLRSYGDPYEQAFVEAMARRREHERKGRTPIELKARNEEADKILEKLFAEDGDAS